MTPRHPLPAPLDCLAAQFRADLAQEAVLEQADEELEAGIDSPGAARVLPFEGRRPAVEVARHRLFGALAATLLVALGAGYFMGPWTARPALPVTGAVAHQASGAGLRHPPKPIFTDGFESGSAATWRVGETR